MHKAGRNVVTSRRRVNENRSQQAATTRRQRYFCLSIIKRKKGTINQGIKGRTNKGTESRAAGTKSAEKRPTFVFFFFSDKTANVL